MVVESIILHVGSKSSLSVKLGWDLVIKAVAFYSHHFHTQQTIQRALVFLCSFIQVFPFICPLSVDDLQGSYIRKFAVLHAAGKNALSTSLCGMFINKCTLANKQLEDSS